MVFNVPPPRYNPISPYDGTYSQYQLDMRRKAEILKYSNNASSSKTNNLSKAQRWAQIVNGYKGVSYPAITITTVDYNENYNTITVKYPNTLKTVPTYQYVTDGSGKAIPNKNAYRIVGSAGYYSIIIAPDADTIGCVQDELIPTPTSSSDVPGPITYLYNDETVPLYNYVSNVNSYSRDTNNVNTAKWSITQSSDIFLINGQDNTFFTMMINKEIDQSSYTYSVTLPISLYVSGTNLNLNSDTDWHFNDLSVGINYIDFGVKYNNTNIPFKTIPVIKLSGQDQALTYSNGSYYGNNICNLLQFDVSFGSVTDTVDSYTAKLYIGTITISDIILRTDPGYVYDFYLQINTTDISNRTITYNNSITTTTIGTYVNVSSDVTIGNNCVVKAMSPAPPRRQPLTVYGV